MANIRPKTLVFTDGGNTYILRGMTSEEVTKLTNAPSLQDIQGKLDASLKGAIRGVAELDNNGKVPASQLPSFVDDVLEYDSIVNFPETGETGKIYVDTTTNKTYRWSGSTYVAIAGDLTLGETSSTAYRGDRGAEAYAHAVTNKGSAFSSGLYKITTNSEGHVIAATAVEKADIVLLGIPASDTTYQSRQAVNGGLDVSLVTTGEKYIWNNKQDASQVSSAINTNLTSNTRQILNALSLYFDQNEIYEEGDLCIYAAAGNYSEGSYRPTKLFRRKSWGNDTPVAEAFDYNKWDVVRLESLLVEKVDKETGKGLSTNDFTDAYKHKLDEIAEGATANTGTVTSITAGTGLTGGTISSSGTIALNLKSTTALVNSSVITNEVNDRIYPVLLDADGKLAVMVPWTDSGASVMTGADASNNGTAGMVPAPSAGDESKYLRGDGTWQDISGIGDVQGPNGATSDYVVVFDGYTGKLIKNSGHSLSEYALLNSSPVFTGTNVFIKGSSLDITKANNNVSDDIYHNYIVTDNNGNSYALFEGGALANGKTISGFFVKNYKTADSEFTGWRGMYCSLDKSNTLTWSVAEPSAFRTAISAKGTQSAVSDPTASGTSATFIDSISQNAQGVITATKKTVRTFTKSGSSAASGLVPAPSTTAGTTKFLCEDATWKTALTAHQSLDGKKNTQTAVSSPSASGSTNAFIDTISQNAQGVITVTKKYMHDASTTQSGSVNTGTQSFAGAKTFTGAVYQTAGFRNMNSATSPTIGFSGSGLDESNAAIYAINSEASGKYGNVYFQFYHYSPASNGASRTDYSDRYRLPSVASGKTGNNTYDILTTKTAPHFAYFSIAANSNKTFTVGNSFRGVFYLIGTNSSYQRIVTIYSTSSGAIAYSNFSPGSDINTSAPFTFTTGTGTFKITNNGGYTIHVHIMVFSGSVS